MLVKGNKSIVNEPSIQNVNFSNITIVNEKKPKKGNIINKNHEQAKMQMISNL